MKEEIERYRELKVVNDFKEIRFFRYNRVDVYVII